MNRVELKSIAKQRIKGRIGSLFLIALIVYLCEGGVAGLALIPIIGWIAMVFVTFPFELSMVITYLAVARGKDIEAKYAFSGFNQFGGAICTYLLMGIYTFLWSLLLIIPGIIKSISYSMAPYILADDPSKSASQCINESKVMMNGHKMDYFILELSFIGWMLVGILTFGIAYIWI